MVQIIEEPMRRPSFGAMLGHALGEAGASGLGAYSQKKQMQAQQNAMKQLGIPEGTPPELAKVFLAEQMKQQGKESLLGQKQGYLDKLFGGQGQGQQQSMGKELSQVQQLQQGSQGSGQGFDPTTLSDAQIAQATAIDPAIGRDLRHAKDVGLRERSASEKRSFEREKFEYGKASEKEKMARHEAEAITRPLMLELQQARKNIPLQEQAIEDIKMASPAVGSLDYLADVTGFEPLRSSEGAKLKTAIKDYFLSDLTRVGARPNQWVEQQLLDALPKIGRSAEANLITAEGLKFKNEIAKKRIDVLDDLAAKDTDKFGYVKPDIDSRASKLLKPFVEQQKKDLVDNITSIKRKHKTLAKEEQKGKYIRVLSPEGQMLDILPSDLKEAEEHGYIRQ